MTRNQKILARNPDLAARVKVILTNSAVHQRDNAEDAIAAAYSHICGLSKDAEYLASKGRFYLECWVEIFYILGECPLYLVRNSLLNDEHLGVRTCAKALAGGYEDDLDVKVLDTEMMSRRVKLSASAEKIAEVGNHFAVAYADRTWRDAVYVGRLRV